MTYGFFGSHARPGVPASSPASSSGTWRHQRGAATRLAGRVVAALFAAALAAPGATAQAGGQTAAAGLRQTCAITAGTLRCWGANERGQLGTGTLVDRTAPTRVVGMGRALAVDTYDGHTCAIDGDGRVACWGANTSGQLGDGTTEPRLSPVVVALPLPATSVVVGEAFSCAATTDRRAYCWGANASGQLGDGTAERRLLPVLVGAGVQAASLTAGERHACALRPDGGVACWGAQGAPLQGGAAPPGTSVPAIVPGLAPGVRSIAAGAYHTCALLTTGGVRCWGSNEAGEIGDGTGAARALPTDVVGLSQGVRAIGAGLSSSCALAGRDELLCWGVTFVRESRPARSRLPVQISLDARDEDRLDLGGNHGCLSTPAGAVRCWGLNDAGQLGLGTGGRRVNPVPVVGASGGILAAASEYAHTCVVYFDGRVACFGLNNGTFGDASTTNRQSIPMQAVPGVTATQVSTGENFSCATTTDGRAMCWGLPYAGQLGSGNVARFDPQPVVGLDDGAVAEVAAGANFACARTTLRPDGSGGGVRCWGTNFGGQLGDGTFSADRPRAADVEGLTSGVVDLTAGRGHACAVLADGRVYCWGANGYGELGNDGTQASASPVPVALFASADRVEAGQFHTCATLRDGSLRCWGRNNTGQLGDGTTTNRATPVAVVDIDGFVARAVGAGGGHTCASFATPTSTYCWGENALGALGTGEYSRTGRGTARPQRVAIASIVTALTAGVSHTCARTGSSILCWGSSNVGALGDGQSWLDAPARVTLTSAPAPIRAGASEAATLSAIAPTPASGAARATLRLGTPGSVTVTVVDVLGRERLRVFEGVAGAEQALDLDATGLAPGLYVLRATGAGGLATSRPFVVAR